MNCRKLIGTLPNYLPFIEKFENCDCQKLVVSISNLPKCELNIAGSKKVVVGNSIDLCSVKDINLSSISKFAGVTKEMMPLRSLRNLELENCLQVIFIRGTGEEKTELLHDFKCLTELKIVNLPKLISLLADSLPSTIKGLVISKRENLRCLLEDGKNINSSDTPLIKSFEVGKCNALKSLSLSNKLLGLKELAIKECKNLQCLLENGENINFRGRSLLECLEIGNFNALKSSSSNKLLVRLEESVIRECENLRCLLEDRENINFNGTTC